LKYKEFSPTSEKKKLMIPAYYKRIAKIPNKTCDQLDQISKDLLGIPSSLEEDLEFVTSHLRLSHQGPSIVFERRKSCRRFLRFGGVFKDCTSFIDIDMILYTYFDLNSNQNMYFCPNM